MRGADLVMKLLAERGVDTVFTLSGNHIMVLFDAALDHGPRLVHTRHEAAAVHMADAYGRLTGRAGIAMVTGGPGHANACPALFTALGADSPVLLISGHAPTDQLGNGAFQELDQVAMAAPVTKGSFLCRSVDTLAADLTAALDLAEGGRPGPVHLSLPGDIIEPELPATPEGWASPPGQSFAATATDADWNKAAAWVSHAKRPLMIAGPVFSRPPAATALPALADRLGIPVAVQESPRGLNDPSLGAVAEIMPEADLLILLNKACDFTVGFAMPPACAADVKVIAISADPAQLAFARDRKGDDAILLHSDHEAALAKLGAFGAHKPTAESGWWSRVADAIAYRPEAWSQPRASVAGRVHPLEMCAAIKPFIDAHPDTVLICDGGEIGQWAQATLTANRRLTNSVTGSIGACLPFAIAARVVEPQGPVVTIMGDGTVGFHLAEFETAVRSRTPFIAIIGNDAAWNAEHQIQINSYGAQRAIGCELLPAAYEDVCTALGGFGAKVTRAEDMPDALAAAHASGLPACINVMLDGQPAPRLRRKS